MTANNKSRKNRLGLAVFQRGNFLFSRKETRPKKKNKEQPKKRKGGYGNLLCQVRLIPYLLT